MRVLEMVTANKSVSTHNPVMSINELRAIYDSSSKKHLFGAVS